MLGAIQQTKQKLKKLSWNIILAVCANYYITSVVVAETETETEMSGPSVCHNEIPLFQGSNFDNPVFLRKFISSPPPIL